MSYQVWAGDGKTPLTIEGPINPEWLVSEDKNEAYTIMARYCEAHGVTEDDLTGYSRKRPIVIHRHRLMAEIRNETSLSYPAMGIMFNRHHTSIMAAVKSQWVPQGESQ